MNLVFKRIILYVHQYPGKQGVKETLQRLLTFLNTQNLELYQVAETAEDFALELPILARKDMGLSGDLIIVIGGDGSLLSAARMATQVNTPVIGINRGRLGFLTDILPQNLEQQIAKVLSGHYEEEHRFLLKASVVDSDAAVLFQGHALNDVVLGRGSEPHLIEFDAYVDAQFVSHFQADGMIISTPTGSTAYALSAGGPIMHPKLNAIVLVPMFSHRLSSRPLVIDGQAKIELHSSLVNEVNLRISCDGHESAQIKPGERVLIAKNNKYLRLLHPSSYHYYETLRSKLGWESKHQSVLQK